MSRNLYDVTDVRTDKILLPGCHGTSAGQDRIIGQTCLSICTKLFHLQGIYQISPERKRPGKMNL